MDQTVKGYNKYTKALLSDSESDDEIIEIVFSEDEDNENTLTDDSFS